MSAVTNRFYDPTYIHTRNDEPEEPLILTIEKIIVFASALFVANVVLVGVSYECISVLTGSFLITGFIAFGCLAYFTNLFDEKIAIDDAQPSE